ncbi:MAG: hypothetical protein ACOCO0_09500, partial [Prevotella sp.]
PFWKVNAKLRSFSEKNENMTLKILKTIARLTKWCLSSHKQNVKLEYGQRINTNYKETCLAATRLPTSLFCFPS